MNPLKRIYCRIFQAGFYIALPFLPYREPEILEQLKGLLRVLRRIPTLVAIPTTAGTGSEVTLTAVITDSEKNTSIR